MTAFAVDQGVLPPGTLDVSRSDLTADGAQVVITTDVEGVVVLRWVPVGDVGSLATLAQDAPLSWSYTPTPAKPGTFVIEFTPDAGGAAATRAHRILAPNGTAIPAFNEKADPDADLVNSGAPQIAASHDNEPKGGIAYAGWWFTYHDALLALDAALGDQHTHANKAQLDLVADGDHDARTDNPHGVTAAQAGAEVAGAVATHAGLSDPHTGYSLADGSRAFTGAVGGVSPVAGADLATKDYVDGLIQGLEWQDPVLDKDLTAPPGSPAPGDRYIVAVGGTGAWAGQDNAITEWDGAAWQFIPAVSGLAARVEDEGKLYTFNGSAWVNLGEAISHASLMDLTTGDPHTQYQLRSEKDQPGGYAGLDGSGLLDPAQVPGEALNKLLFNLDGEILFDQNGDAFTVE